MQVKFLHANFPLNLNTPSRLLGKILSFFFFYFFFSLLVKKCNDSILAEITFPSTYFFSTENKRPFSLPFKGWSHNKGLIKSPVYLLWSLIWLPDNESALLTMGPTTGSAILGLCPLQRKWYLWLYFCLWEGRLFSALHGSLRKTAVLSGNMYTYTHKFSSVPVSWLLRVCWISCHSDCLTHSVVLS